MSNPMNSIDEWQKWYKQNKVVAELDEPMVTKSSREKLHDTTNTKTSLADMVCEVAMQKATGYFGDTLAEFSSDLSAQQLFQALLNAAHDNYEAIKKEHDHAKEFLNLLTSKNNEEN
jgi:hypothetical protein